MKRILRFSMLFAAALTAFACSKDQTDPTIDNPDAAGTMTLRLRAENADERPEASASAPDTRTTFAGGDENPYNLKWLDTDEVGVYIASTVPSANLYALPDRAADGTVSFMVDNANTYTADDYIYAYYPYSADNDAAAADQVALAIPAVQEQTSTGVFDGRYNPMISVPTKATEVIPSEGGNATLRFRQLAAMAEFDIYSTDAAHENEIVRSISFTDAGGGAIAGTFAYDLTAPGEGAPAAIDAAKLTDASDAVTVNVAEGEAIIATEPGGLATLYMALIPGSYTGGVTVTTDKAAYTFPDKTIDFQRAYVKRFKLNLANAAASERIMGTYVWTLDKDQMGTASKPVTSAAFGTPAMKWNLKYESNSGLYLGSNADKGFQIGSGTHQVNFTASTSAYGDEIKSIVINTSVASSGKLLLTVLLDGKAVGEPVAVTNTDATDYTFTPTTPVKASTIQIKLESQVKKAMYLKSVTIVSANQQATELAAPAVTVDTEAKTFGWDADASAKGYEYTLDGGQTPVSVESGSTSVSYAQWAEGTYEVQVRALGDGVAYTTSAWSEAVTIEVKKEVVDPSAPRYIKVTEALTDWSGEYIIAAEHSNKVYALNGKEPSKNLGAYEEITASVQSDGSILSTPTIAGYACTVAHSANGYTILSKDGYIGTQDSNNLYFNATATAKQDEWNLSFNSDGTVTIKNVEWTDRSLQYNSGSPRFATYTGTQVKPVLYKLEDKTPRIEVAEADKTLQFAATTTEGSIAFKAKNLTADVTATVTGAAGNWFNATVDNAAGTVDWTAAENTGSTPRTATLTLSSAGAADVVIAVEQLGQAQQIVMPEIKVDDTQTTATSLTVTFAAVEGAGSFSYSAVPTAGGDAVTGEENNGEATSLTIDHLQPATEYTVTVTVTANGTTHKGTATSNAVTATTAAGSAEPVYELYYTYSGEALGTSTTYASYTKDITNSNITINWTATLGNAQSQKLWLGSNSNQKSKAHLTDAALAAAVGATTSTLYIAALIDNTPMPNIGKVVFTCDAAQSDVKVFLVAITDSGEYKLVGEQASIQASTEYTFTFDRIVSARYALVAQKTSGYVRINEPHLTFYTQQ